MRTLLLLFALLIPMLSAQEREFRPRQVVKPFAVIKNAPIKEADEIGDMVRDDELVVGVVVGGKARAYPINMLTNPTREIINDDLGGRSIAATW